MLVPVAWLDSPRVVLPGGGTPIPAVGSLPEQVVASLAHSATAVFIVNLTGGYVDILIGPPGQEKLLCGSVGATPQQREFSNIPKGSRISLRSIDGTTITTGSFYCEFLADLH